MASAFGIAVVLLLVFGPRISRKAAQAGMFVCTRCFVRYSYQDLEGSEHAT